MRIDIVSIFPEMLDAFSAQGIVGRARTQGLLQMGLWNPRNFADNRHRNVDDRPYGGGPGMVMQAQPLQGAIQAARQAAADAIAEKGTAKELRLIYLSPQGRRLDHAGVLELAASPALVLVAGRYEGIDERLFAMEPGEEWSIGDYVLSGGETAAMVIVDAVVRQLPGALGDEASAQQDSFVQGLLDCAHYTRPEDYQGHKVPAVLLSGDHQRIQRWRLKQALGRTWLRRPDLLQALSLDREQQRLLAEFQQEYKTGVQDE